MVDSPARPKVLEAFNKDNFYYSHVLPAKFSDFIDGMAWTGILCGAALKVNDIEIADLCRGYIRNILKVGKDARNYAPLQVKEDWVPSTTMPGFWYTVKPQAFAGPAALTFANNCGAGIETDLDVKLQAKMMVAGGFFYGILAKHISALRQHIDSMWFAHLMLNKKPSSTMLWMTEENPLFAYIAGKKQTVTYPDPHRFTEGVTAAEKSIVPLKDCEPSAWIFRRDPFNRYTRAGIPMQQEYTPIWQLVGDYLQDSL